MEGNPMLAKHQYYSLAFIDAITRDVPTAIMLGKDCFYWVVDRDEEGRYSLDGCLLLTYGI